MTALYDAIGRAISTVRERYENDGSDPARVMLVILTDGEENASHEYTREQIVSMIDTCQKDLKWAVMYLSASVDAFKGAGSIGINSAHTIRFAHTGSGMRCAAMTMNFMVADYNNTGTIGTAQSYAAAVDPKGKNLTTQPDK